MVKTRSVKSSGRFAQRYGATLRKRVLTIEKKTEKGQRCPRCKSVNTLHRMVTGIWACKSCGMKFAGGAYIAQTTLGKTMTPEEFKSSKAGPSWESRSKNKA
jgi:large subunit ribosomal protein L37Ae